MLVVVGRRPNDDDFGPFYDPFGSYEINDYSWDYDVLTLDDGGQSHCATSGQNVTTPMAPDGAIYRVPPGVTSEYVKAAINYLGSLLPGAKEVEFARMYTDPGHPHFIDLKDWGTANGPPGSVGEGAESSYYSAAAGVIVTGSPYAAFGNWLYGYVGTLGGIFPEVLTYTSGLVQTGNDALARAAGTDAAEDRPHVALGIADAQYFAATGEFNQIPGAFIPSCP